MGNFHLFIIYPFIFVCLFFILSFIAQSDSYESEIHKLRMALEERYGKISALEGRVGQLEAGLEEQLQKNKHLMVEKSQVSSDLEAARKKAAFLTNFKNTVIQSLQDETVAGGGSEATRGLAGMYSPQLAEPEKVKASYVPGRSPHGGSASHAADLISHIDRSMAQSREERVSMPPRAPSFRRSTEDSAPPEVEGKEFFRMARIKLSPEAYQEFLLLIRNLNAYQITKEEALEEAAHIFSPENEDLVEGFRKLLK
jgi:hypothetical protein